MIISQIHEKHTLYYVTTAYTYMYAYIHTDRSQHTHMHINTHTTHAPIVLHNRRSSTILLI